MVSGLVFAGGSKEKANQKVVGVAMPTQSSERWINDGANIKKQLEAKGYEVDLQYAEDDVQMQVSQLENMIAKGEDCLVVAAIDSVAILFGTASGAFVGFFISELHIPPFVVTLATMLMGRGLT